MKWGQCRQFIELKSDDGILLCYLDTSTHRFYFVNNETNWESHHKKMSSVLNLPVDITYNVLKCYELTDELKTKIEHYYLMNGFQR